jgi:hypothetical protein
MRRPKSTKPLVSGSVADEIGLEKVAEEIRELRKGNKLGRLTVRKLISTGRRF